MELRIGEEMQVGENLNDLTVQLDRVADLLQGRLLQFGYEKYDEYALNEPHVQTSVFYFKHAKVPVHIRCSCHSFAVKANHFENLHSVQLNVTLINDEKLKHFEHLDIGIETKLRVFEDYMQELKEAVFGPENAFLKTVFRGDGELTMKLFNLCALEDVIKLRQTCKTAYRKSNTPYLDTHYWKKQLVQLFGEDQLPTTNSTESTPYRKALFKKLRDQDKAAFIQSIQAAARQDAMGYYHPRTLEDDDRVAPRDFRRRDPYGIDPLRTFEENFYGQEVYRPRNPNPYVPNAPLIYPHFHGDPTSRRRQDPDMPQGPFNSNQFI